MSNSINTAVTTTPAKFDQDRSCSISDLHKTIINNRFHGKALSVEDFGGSKTMYNNWKNALRLLQDCVSTYAVAQRNKLPKPEVDAARDALFGSWRSVLNFFKNATDDFKIKPEADDVQALLTISGKLVMCHSQEYKDASAAKSAAKKDLDLVSERKMRYEKAKENNNPLSGDEKVFTALLADVMGEATETRSIAQYQREYENACAEFERVKGLRGSSWYEFTPYGEAAFRKGLEDLICDRIEGRLSKTSQEIREEKQAKNRKRNEERKAAEKKQKKETKSENKAA